jgi:hypothetical protein
MYKLIGAIIGGLLGFVIPFLIMLYYFAFGEEGSAQGASTVFPMIAPITALMGIGIGWRIGGIIYAIKNKE